jgi:hypothetical protein
MNTNRPTTHGSRTLLGVTVGNCQNRSAVADNGDGRRYVSDGGCVLRWVRQSRNSKSSG